MLQLIKIFRKAINKYKELTEGQHKDEVVDKI